MMVMLSHPMTSLTNTADVTLVTPNDVSMISVTSPGGANCEGTAVLNLVNLRSTALRGVPGCWQSHQRCQVDLVRCNAQWQASF